MAEEFKVTVHIAGRPYRLLVKREEEAELRKATKLVEEQIDHYAGIYKYNDIQDLLAMAALHFASNALNAEEETAYVQDQLRGALESIDEKLTDALKD
jgi:cell division protein ZapA